MEANLCQGKFVYVRVDDGTFKRMKVKGDKCGSLYAIKGVPLNGSTYLFTDPNKRGVGQWISEKDHKEIVSLQWL